MDFRRMGCVAILVSFAFLTACGGGGADAVTTNDAVAANDDIAPVADAGTPQSVPTGTAVTLDASGSTDANSDALTYTWTLTSKPLGSTASLSDATAVKPDFVADLEGTYVFNLVVSDGELVSDTAVVTIAAAVANVIPVANAGTAQNVTTGTVVTLDGSASADANGDAITYAWILTRPPGSTAVLSDATIAAPTFTADVAGDYVAALIVSDGISSSVEATVTTTAAVANVAPVSHAGSAQSVARTAVVTLDGSNSSDANGDTLVYTWSFTTKPAGSAATLSSASAVAPTFTADIAGDYVIQLIVDDGEFTSTPATVTITAAPVASTTDLIVNGSFEQSLAAWTQDTSLDAGAAGTCSYNGTVAPGTETLTGAAGFPATEGTQIALGGVTSSSGVSKVYNCVLYQDVQIPAGLTALTLKFDIGAKEGNDGCAHTGLFVALYSTASVPLLSSPTLGGAFSSLCTSAPAAALTTVTKVINITSLAGTTVRVAFINAADVTGHEVVGIDNVSLVADATN